MPHVPHTVSFSGPPSQPVPSKGVLSTAHLSERAKRMYPSSPQASPQLVRTRK